MSIAVVEQFRDSPGTCMHCGSSGINGGVDEPKIEFEGIDINWGDSAYLCGECVKLICDLANRPTQKAFDKTAKELEEVDDELQVVIKERDELKEKVDRILAGGKAKRELREAANA